MHKKLEDKFAKSKDVVLFHHQTVWEGQDVNTPERGPKETKKFGIEVPVGYDAHVDGARTSIMMHSFGTGGTPWTIVIDKKGIVKFNAVTPGNDGELIKLIEQLRG